MEPGNEDQVDLSAVIPHLAAPCSARLRKEHKRSLVGLANRLGVNPRTIYKWLKRGAPASLDEPAMREWARMNGIRGLRAPLTIDVPRGTTNAPGTTPATGDTGAGKALAAMPPAEGWSPAQRKAIADAALSDDRRRKVQLEIGELEHRLVDRADLVSIVGALSMVYLHELADLPAAAVRTLDRLPVEWQRPMRKAIADAIDGLRGSLEGTLRTKLEALLHRPEVSHAG